MNWIKYIKLILGTILAILIAHLFHLEYAYATGIITLLTIQDTKQETLIVAIKRIIIFMIMTLLSLIIFPLLVVYHHCICTAINSIPLYLPSP